MDVHFTLVGTGGMMGIAQGDLHLPDNIAEIGHGILWNSGPWPVFLKRDTPAGMIRESAGHGIYCQNGPGLRMEPSG